MIIHRPQISKKDAFVVGVSAHGANRAEEEPVRCSPNGEVWEYAD